MNLLTSENYFSPENQLKFMGASQFKAFRNCEAAALSEVRGEWCREESTALLVGSYVDAYFEGSLDVFSAKHPQIFKKDGTPKAEYIQAEAIISRINRDDMFVKFLSGEAQKIMTGEIAGVPFKIKVDAYHQGKCIVDLKVMKDLLPIWDATEGRKLPFVEAWGYDFQGAIYQEVCRQNTGDKLPFIIAAATKQKVPRIKLMTIPQDRLDYCLDEVKSLAPHFDAIKREEESPGRCDGCDFCADTEVLSGIIDYREAG